MRYCVVWLRIDTTVGVLSAGSYLRYSRYSRYLRYSRYPRYPRYSRYPRYLRYSRYPRYLRYRVTALLR